MRLTELDRTKLRNLLIVVVCSTVGSAFFGVLIGEEPSGSFVYRSALIGAYNGCLISLLIAQFRDILRQHRCVILGNYIE